MKVFIINSVFGIGSTGRIVKSLYDTLIESGNTGCIAYSRGRTEENYNIFKIGTKSDLYIHAGLSRLTDRQGFYSKNVTKKLVDEIKKFQPDIIHLHNIHGYYINIEELFAYLKSSTIPVVWTLHDCWPFTGHCAYYDYVKCEKWKTQCKECIQKNTYPKSILIDNSYCNFLKKKECFTSVEKIHFVLPSNWLQEQLKQSFLKKYSSSVIYNGINLSQFQPRFSNIKERYSIQNKKIILGVANVWDERKGLNYFIELGERLSYKYKIVLIGLSKKQLKNIPNNILGIARTNNVEELAEFYTAADIFLNPTLEDNFPTTNLEALACGTPVFTFNTGGAPESIVPSCGKILYSKNIEYIKEMLEAPTEITRESCIEQSKKYDAKKAFDNYIELYKDLL